MKVCNLEAVVTFEDVVRLSDFVCAEIPQVVITPSFSWIKSNLQEVSVALFHTEHDEARRLIRALKSRCLDFVSMLVADKESRVFAEENIESRFAYIYKVIDSPLNLFDDRELLASGEYVSSILVAAYLKGKGLSVALLDSSEFMQLGGDNKPDIEAISAQAKVLTNLVQASVYVMQSRLCKNAYGEVEYMSRGGGDLYAACVAAAFHANELVCWLQAKGLYTQYGESVYKGEHTHVLTFDEAESFVSAGIRLITPACIDIARSYHISIRLMDSKSVLKEALYISDKHESNSVKAVVTRKNVDYIRLRSLGVISSFQFLEKSLSVFAKYKVPVFLMASSSVNISMAVEISMDTFYLIRHDLSRFAEVVIENNISTVSVLGEFDWDKTSVEGQIIDLLKDMPILMISYGSDNNSVSVAVRGKDREKALCILSDTFLNTDFKGHPEMHTGYDAFIV